MAKRKGEETFKLEEPKAIDNFERIQNRVAAAVEELNAALQESHECAEMRVMLAARPMGGGHAMMFIPQIYRLMYTTVIYSVNEKEQEKPMWQVVKDDAFKPASGKKINE